MVWTASTLLPCRSRERSCSSSPECSCSRPFRFVEPRLAESNRLNEIRPTTTETVVPALPSCFSGPPTSRPGHCLLLEPRRRRLRDTGSTDHCPDDHVRCWQQSATRNDL